MQLSIFLIILTCALAWLASIWLNYLENRKLWTLRLRIAVIYDFVVIPYLAATLLVITNDSWPNSVNDGLPGSSAWWGLSIPCVALLGCVNIFYRLHESRVYRRLRWKAWTGLSRTGIPPRYVGYVGDGEDWLALHSSVTNVKLDPVEWGLNFIMPFATGIAPDPTDLLKGRAALDDGSETLWIPRKRERASIYEPIDNNHSVSLLWGSKSYFRPRCSRSIISIPRPLLRSGPRIDGSLDGGPICLAYGILARNKGLEPSTLICNLETSNAFRTFEEGSLYWPRPSKTLRGLYRNVIQATFSLLGTSYVTAATELALLIADVPAEVLEDWLDGGMEQQDITLNHQAADYGASSEDLARLYRGQYVAMLISLSLHRPGLRLRPEILAYDAVCALDQANISQWSRGTGLSERRAEELEIYGTGIKEMLRAII